jgi:hypothetical protein
MWEVAAYSLLQAAAEKSEKETRFASFDEMTNSWVKLFQSKSTLACIENWISSGYECYVKVLLCKK